MTDNNRCSINNFENRMKGKRIKEELEDKRNGGSKEGKGEREGLIIGK